MNFNKLLLAVFVLNTPVVCCVSQDLTFVGEVKNAQWALVCSLHSRPILQDAIGLSKSQIERLKQLSQSTRTEFAKFSSPDFKQTNPQNTVNHHMSVASEILGTDLNSVQAIAAKLAVAEKFRGYPPKFLMPLAVSTIRKSNTSELEKATRIAFVEFQTKIAQLLKKKTDEVLTCLDDTTQKKFRSLIESLDKETLAKLTVNYQATDVTTKKIRTDLISDLLIGEKLDQEIELVDFQIKRLQDLALELQTRPDLVELEKEILAAEKSDDAQFLDSAGKKAAAVEVQIQNLLQQELEKLLLPDQSQALDEIAAGIYAHTKTDLVFEWPVLLSDFLGIKNKNLELLKKKTREARTKFDKRRSRISQDLYEKTIDSAPKTISNMHSEIEIAMELKLQISDLTSDRLYPGNKLR